MSGTAAGPVDGGATGGCGQPTHPLGIAWGSPAQIQTANQKAQRGEGTRFTEQSEHSGRLCTAAAACAWPSPGKGTPMSCCPHATAAQLRRAGDGPNPTRGGAPPDRRTGGRRQRCVCPGRARIRSSGWDHHRRTAGRSVGHDRRCAARVEHAHGAAGLDVSAYSTLPKPGSVAPAGGSSPARRQPWAKGPPGNNW